MGSAMSGRSGATVEQRVGRAAWHGVLVGSVVMIVVGTGLALAAGQGAIESLGLGAFAAVWGGPGFGGMLGAVAAFVREEQREGGPAALLTEGPVPPTSLRGPTPAIEHVEPDAPRTRQAVA